MPPAPRERAALAAFPTPTPMRPRLPEQQQLPGLVTAARREPSLVASGPQAGVRLPPLDTGQRREARSLSVETSSQFRNRAALEPGPGAGTAGPASCPQALGAAACLYFPEQLPPAPPRVPHPPASCSEGRTHQGTEAPGRTSDLGPCWVGVGGGEQVTLGPLWPSPKWPS